MDFKLNTTYGYKNDIHKSKIMKYKPNNLATMHTVETNINITLNREESHLKLRDSYLEREGLLYQMMLVMYLLIMLISD